MRARHARGSVSAWRGAVAPAGLAICGLSVAAMTGCGGVGVVVAPSAPPVEGSVTEGVAEANNRFGFDLYVQMRGARQDLVISPIGATVALTMAAAGARGETQDELVRALHLRTLAGAHPSLAAIIDSLRAYAHADEGDGGTVTGLYAANQLWAQDGFTPRVEFTDLLRDRYKAPLGRVDFARATEVARASINKWASDETRGTVPDLVPEDLLNGSTKLFLASALYFRASWLHPFDRQWTREGAFRGPTGAAVVRLMHQQTRLSYAHADGVSLVELPYQGGLSMVVMLSDAPDGLSGVEERLRDSYDNWLSALRLRLVDLELPKWRATTDARLKGALRTLGVVLAFSPSRADFSGVTDQMHLYVEEVLQKAFLEANEGGTEAAAATGVFMNEMPEEDVVESPPEKVVMFHADHPFVYVVRDPVTRTTLFVGRVVNPK